MWAFGKEPGGKTHGEPTKTKNKNRGKPARKQNTRRTHENQQQKQWQTSQEAKHRENPRKPTSKTVANEPEGRTLGESTKTNNKNSGKNTDPRQPRKPIENHGKPA
jgi:hypothetical protein